MSPHARYLRAAARRPGLLALLLMHLQRAMLLWDISSTEQYLQAAERDGIMDTQTVRLWRSYLQDRHTRLLVLEARMRGEVAA